MGVRETFWVLVKDLPPDELEAKLRRIEAHLRAQAKKMREAKGAASWGAEQPGGAWSPAFAAECSHERG